MIKTKDLVDLFIVLGLTAALIGSFMYKTNTDEPKIYQDKPILNNFDYNTKLVEALC